MSLIKKLKSNNYYKKLKNNKIEIKDINQEYLTSEICLYEIKKHVNYFRIMPKKFINQEISEYVFSKCIDYFEFIPDEFKTQKMCNRVINNSYYNIKFIPKKYRNNDMYFDVINNLDDFINVINFDDVPDNLKQIYVDKAINYNPDYILNADNDYVFEYNWIEAIKIKDSLVFKLPNKYKNKKKKKKKGSFVNSYM